MPPGQVWESRDRGARFVGLQVCAALLEAGTPVAEAIPEGRHVGRTHHPLRRTEKGPRRAPLEGSLDGAECLPVDLVGVKDAGRPRKQNYFTPADVDNRQSNSKGLCAERLQETRTAESPGQVGGRGLGCHGYVLLLNSLAVCFVLVEWDRMEAVLCWWNGTGWRLFCVGGMGQDGGCFVLVEWDRVEAVLCWWNGTGWRLFFKTLAAWNM